MMTESKIRIQQQVFSDYTDDQLLFLKQMGIRYVYVMFRDQHTDYDSVMSFVDRLRKHGLVPTDGGNRTIYKNPAIHLGLPGRDEGIQKFNDFSRILAKAGIPITYMTWEPNGVLTTKYAVGNHTRDAVARLVDVKQLETLPYSHGRFYSKDEMWENFQYFLDNTLPVCQEIGMKIALHPNDPPVPSLRGISNLITSAEDYKKAFAMAKESPYLGMKLCVGCWLEGGATFGNLLEDIKYFVENKKVFCVHFRNVSGCVPCFEETLIEDGYMDMYQVMKQFVDCGYDGLMTVDHVPEYVASCGGKNSSYAYSIGYIKALLSCAAADKMTA
ncbi:MAG: mannonate dehydratase [Lachnospiraceae bacterium]|nr:mannonate dehydratase [Lachnospiraceae bacterium]